jgi:hypothetical protein
MRGKLALAALVREHDSGLLTEKTVREKAASGGTRIRLAARTWSRRA